MSENTIVTTELPDPREKLWTVYLNDQTTVVIKVVDTNTIAVARSFRSQTDKFSRKKGRAIALSRMRNLLAMHETTGVTRYTTKYGSKENMIDKHVIFEVINYTSLGAEELEFYKKLVLPRVNAYFQIKD